MRQHLLALLTAATATFATTATTTAQNATFTTFGASSGSTTGPILDVTGLPQVGTTFSISVDYTNMPPFCTLQITNWQALLVFGFSNTQWAGLTLPASFPQGFDLLVGADFASYQTTMSDGCPPRAGNAPVYSVTIPNDPGLVGFTWYNQIILAEIGRTTAMATDGGIATVGF
ncbi:MAG: hypothetical protein NXI31_04055 [bacterium]|nr:hypothetical protein [bacterium]